MSLNAFSQTVTDSTKIQLTKPIARLVIKDLVKFDGLSQEVIAVRSILDETNSKVEAQSLLVANLEQQILNMQSIINQKNQQLEAQAKISEEFKTALKKEVRTKKLYKIAGTAGAAAMVLLLIK